MTILITSLLIALSFAIHRHYVRVTKELSSFDEILTELPPASTTAPTALDPSSPTAVVLVKSFTGFGIHTVLSITGSSPPPSRISSS